MIGRRLAAIGVLVAVAVLAPLPAFAADDGDILIGVEIEPRRACAPECSPPGDHLARTGVDLVPLASLALGLALVGGVMVTADNARRRREQNELATER